jgi:ankyrin repeat protein
MAAQHKQVTALIRACKRGHAAVAATLLERGANPDKVIKAVSEDHVGLFSPHQLALQTRMIGFSALHFAVLRSHVSVVQALLQWGANKNIRVVRSGGCSDRRSLLPVAL